MVLMILRVSLVRVKPLYVNSGAYSFTTFAGVPAMELRFTEVSFILQHVVL